MKTVLNKLYANLGRQTFGRTVAHAANKKINTNFLFGGFIASYESFRLSQDKSCVNEQLSFVSTVVHKLLQIKNFVYPLCVSCNLKNAMLTLN